MKTIAWRYRVPFIKNTYLFRSILLWYLVTIVFTSVIFSIIFISEGNMHQLGQFIFPMLLVYLFVFILVIIATWIVLGNKYALDNRIDEKGLTIEGSREQALNVKKLALAAGILSGKPGLTGAGLLVKGGNQIFIPWNEINHIEVDQHRNRLIVKCSFWKQVALHYPQELRSKIEELIGLYNSKN